MIKFHFDKETDSGFKLNYLDKIEDGGPLHRIWKNPTKAIVYDCDKEGIVLIIRKATGNLSIFGLYLTAILLLLVLLIALPSKLLIEYRFSIAANIFAISYLLIINILFFLFFIRVVHWFYNICVITRLHVYQFSLVLTRHSKLHQLPLQNLEAIEIIQKGTLQIIFNFAKIRLICDDPENNIEILYIHKPEHLKNVIAELAHKEGAKIKIGTQ